MAQWVDSLKDSAKNAGNRIVEGIQQLKDQGIDVDFDKDGKRDLTQLRQYGAQLGDEFLSAVDSLIAQGKDIYKNATGTQATTPPATTKPTEKPTGADDLEKKEEKEEPGFMGFIKKNGMGLLAGIGTLLLGGLFFPEMGMLLTIVLAVAAFLGGSYFGDENGVLNGGAKTPAPTPSGVSPAEGESTGQTTQPGVTLSPDKVAELRNNPTVDVNAWDEKPNGKKISSKAVSKDGVTVVETDTFVTLDPLTGKMTRDKATVKVTGPNGSITRDWQRDGGVFLPPMQMPLGKDGKPDIDAYKEIAKKRAPNDANAYVLELIDQGILKAGAPTPSIAAPATPTPNQPAVTGQSAVPETPVNTPEKEAKLQEGKIKMQEQIGQLQSDFSNFLNGSAAIGMRSHTEIRDMIDNLKRSTDEMTPDTQSLKKVQTDIGTAIVKAQDLQSGKYEGGAHSKDKNAAIEQAKKLEARLLEIQKTYDTAIGSTPAQGESQSPAGTTEQKQSSAQQPADAGSTIAATTEKPKTPQEIFRDSLVQKIEQIQNDQKVYLNGPDGRPEFGRPLLSEKLEKLKTAVNTMIIGEGVAKIDDVQFALKEASEAAIKLTASGYLNVEKAADIRDRLQDIQKDLNTFTGISGVRTSAEIPTDIDPAVLAEARRAANRVAIHIMTGFDVQESGLEDKTSKIVAAPRPATDHDQKI